MEIPKPPPTTKRNTRKKCPSYDLTSDAALEFVMEANAKKQLKTDKKKANDQCIKAALAQKAKKERFIKQCIKKNRMDLV
jgi:hypothetical protein